MKKVYRERKLKRDEGGIRGVAIKESSDSTLRLKTKAIFVLSSSFLSSFSYIDSGGNISQIMCFERVSEHRDLNLHEINASCNKSP